MGPLIVKNEVSIGDLVTAVSILVSFLTLFLTWSRQQQLRRKEYADRIRRSAGTVIAKIERWKDLTLRFFDDIQPLITDADSKLYEEKDVTKTRDFLWRELVNLRSITLGRISDEEIEIAYVDLYGYDPLVQVLFVDTVRQLKDAERWIHGQILKLFQQYLLALQNHDQPYESAQLGNGLRLIAELLGLAYDRQIEGVISPFRGQMTKLIGANDREIVRRKVQLQKPSSDMSEVNTRIELYHSLLTSLAERNQTGIQQCVSAWMDERPYLKDKALLDNWREQKLWSRVTDVLDREKQE